MAHITSDVDAERVAVLRVSGQHPSTGLANLTVPICRGRICLAQVPALPQMHLSPKATSFMAPPEQHKRPGSPQSSSAEKNRLSEACISCRRRKVKCSGTVPCAYCEKRGFQCTKIGSDRRRRSHIEHIRKLEDRLAQYEQVQNGSSANNLRGRPESQGHGSQGLPEQQRQRNQRRQQSFTVQIESTDPVGDAADQPNVYGVLNPEPAADRSSPNDPGPLGLDSSANGTTRDDSATNTSPRSTIPSDAALSSSAIFGSRVLELLQPSPTAQGSNERPPNNPSSIQPSLHDYSSPLPELPSKAEAQRLVRIVHFYIGQTQSYYDPRVFSDRLETFYAEQNDQEHTKTLWFLQMLVVLALGKLITGDFDADAKSFELPGEKLFNFAVKNIPTLADLYVHGSLAVEVLALAALYSQNIDRQGEAYVYISTALRLAVTHGFHRQTGTHRLILSERVQLNRLWWTVYIQERRLAAATGNPCGISDDSIEIDLPRDSPGFVPAAPLHLNVKIARITGRIISILYGPNNERSEDDFVSKVQEIIHSLYEISNELPSKLSTDVSGPGPALSIRTSASLQLMLLQATLLTIRPIMLHVAQQILSGRLPSGEALTTSSLGKLSRTCSEAAWRMLNIVIALKERKILAIFGFFDCDATFSAAFVMILTAIFDSVCPAEQRQLDSSLGLEEALRVLQYLAQNKNRFAVQRLEEVRNVWQQIKSYLDERQASSGSTGSQSTHYDPNPECPVVPQYGARQADNMQGMPLNSQEPRPEPAPGAIHWAEGMNQGENGVRTFGLDIGGSQDAMLSNTLWDDITNLWHPLGDLNEGVLNDWEHQGQETCIGDSQIVAFLNDQGSRLL
ncbi:hypothetical protein CC79DRAFT_1357747 [Sarocladium strictum]